MKEKKKIPWGLIYVGLTVVVMIVFGLVNTEFAGMFSVIANLSLGFVALAVLMTGVFLVTEGGIIHMLLRAQGEHVGFWTTVKIGLIGIYYSYITPSSTGGQPAQVVYLRRDKVSVGNSTAVLFVKFFAYQLAFVLCTVASLIYMYPSLKRDDPQLIPIVLLGIAINGLWIIAIPLLFSPKILKKLCGGVTKLLLKCTFLKKRENYMEKVQGGFLLLHNEIQKQNALCAPCDFVVDPAGHFADERAVRGVPRVFTRPALRRTALYADDAAGLRVLYPAARCIRRTRARLLHVL